MNAETVFQIYMALCEEEKKRFRAFVEKQTLQKPKTQPPPQSPPKSPIDRNQIRNYLIEFLIKLQESND